MDKEKNQTFAVRTAWSEPGTSPYFVSVAVMRARTFAEYEKAVAHWGKPALNLVYADVKGNIAWTPRGYAPIRPNWDGLLPVPGDGKYEWSGTWTGAQLPLRYNPPSGYLTTSNEMNLPPDYPYKERKLGFEWSDPSRHQRIDEVLSQQPKVSLEDSMRLQNDELSIPARRLLALLRPLTSDDAETQAALQLLQDGTRVSIRIRQRRHWKKSGSRAICSPPSKLAVLGSQAAGLFDAPNTQVLLEWLEHSGAQRDQLLLTTLAAAYAEMKTLQGPDPGQWAWGKLHHNFSEHPFSRVVDEAEQKQLDVGPFETGGSAFTVNASSYRARDFLQLSGPSVRMVLDVGNWDNSRAVNYPGESGRSKQPALPRSGAYVESGNLFSFVVFATGGREVNGKKNSSRAQRKVRPHASTYVSKGL